MKKTLPVSLVFLFFAAGLLYFGKPAVNPRQARLAYERRINAITRDVCRNKATEKREVADQPDMAALQEFLMTMDPATGTFGKGC